MRKKTKAKQTSLVFGRQGFTLIEILVVIAVISLIVLMVAPNMTGLTRLSMETAAREMASVVKEAYNSTVVTGKVHRLVYDLDNQEYWVEIGPSNYMLHTEESLKREEERNRFKVIDEEEEAKKKASIFRIEESVTDGKQELPLGVQFEDIESQQSPEPFESGIVYTHIFPHGATEQTIIHLTDGSENFTTLVLSSLIGKTQVFRRYVEKKELFAKP